MKIIYYSAHPNINMAAPSGPGTHIREVVNALRANECEVITLIAGGETLAQQHGQIVYAKRTWKRWIPSWVWQTLKDFKLMSKDREMGRQLRELIATHKPDAVYERAAYLMESGSKICQSMGVRHLVELNAPYPEEKVQMEGRSLFIRRSQRVEKHVVLNAHAVFTVSSAMKSYLEKGVGKVLSNIVVVPNAVNVEWINSKSDQAMAVRDELQIDKQSLVIGFVGSIFPYHGVDRMIQAAAELKKSGNHRFTMCVVGGGEILPALKKMAVEMGVADAFVFTGNVPHQKVQSLIHMMDVCVMPRSNWYGSPVKIFEYGALGKCIVGPNVVPVRDVMTHEVDGLLIEDTPDALANALLYLVEKPEKKQRMALHFQQKVHQQYTWERVASTIMETIR
jgi:glycosyltransferase involved in cell wall biosynthesis